MTPEDETYLILKFGEVYKGYMVWLGNTETVLEFHLTPEEHRMLNNIFANMSVVERISLLPEI